MIDITTEKGAETPKLLGRDPTTGTGGGSFSDLVKVTVVTVANEGSTVDHNGKKTMGETSFSVVTLIIVGIGSEVIKPIATIDLEKGTKTSPKGDASALKSVTADSSPMAGVLKLAILVIGSDVSIYVAEVHILRKVPLTIDMSVALVAKRTTKHPLTVHREFDNLSVRE